MGISSFFIALPILSQLPAGSTEHNGNHGGVGGQRGTWLQGKVGASISAGWEA